MEIIKSDLPIRNKFQRFYPRVFKIKTEICADKISDFKFQISIRNNLFARIGKSD
jgi:transcriptional antiterminator